ncbi:MAG TPA: sn-glycerol-3-phosphate ABC transporter ATP-binding protein UgpC [Ktedonobacterales bacterium]
MADVKFEHVTKRYSEQMPVIKDLSLHVRDSEFLVLVGPSGCGKSTALRMIAGLEEISEGELFIGERLVNEVAPKDRDIAMVFQNYALYPHMTVFDNMAFALKLRHTSHEEMQQRVERAAQMLGITPYLKRKPRELSGGQRQRVALGRALVRDPQVYLLDEPLSNLDAKLRVQTRAEISRLHQATGTTFVYVTHDQVEAMTMGDRIAVLNAGIIQQLGTPQDLYDHPANLFVAGFIGSPSMNLFNAKLIRGDGGASVIIAGDDGTAMGWTLRGRVTDQLAGHATPDGRPVIVGIRPEGLQLASGLETNTVSAVADVIEHLGNEQYVYLRLPGAIVVDTAETQGTIARLPAGVQVRVGQTLHLTADPDALHLFDPATTNRLA